MTGLHLSHYAIEAELGRGGMGIVYRAKDTKLNRRLELDGSVFLAPPHTTFDVMEGRIALIRSENTDVRSNEVQVITGLGSLFAIAGPGARFMTRQAANNAT